MKDRDYNTLAIPIFLLLGLGFIHSGEHYDLESKLDEMTPKIQTENVLREETPETFYVIDNDTTYLTIDGKPVSQYFPR